MTKSKASQTAEVLTTPVDRAPPIPPEDFLSTGCTQLNLAFSGHPQRGIPKGCYLHLWGDSGSMKTWLAFAILAEASINDQFKKHALIYDAPENGAWFDIPHYFGPRLAERVRPPRGTRTKPVYSRTVQEFYYTIDAALNKGPVIWVEDSMDALNAEQSEDKFEEKKAVFEGRKKKAAGSYGMDKAKENSQNINRVVRRLRDTGSILIVISQSRAKLDSPFPGAKGFSGGGTLKFYGHLEAFTSVRCPITKTYLGAKREIGSLIKIDVQKNRLTGWEGKIEVPFIKGYGIDDLGGCVDYLLEEGHWKAQSDSDDPTFEAPEFKFKGRKETLIKKLQEDGDEYELRLLTAKVWNLIIEGARPNRKPRYT